MPESTLTIDCQVHAYEKDSLSRPWQGFLQGPDEVTGDDMVAAMDSVGVDGAILISPASLYAYDASYALEVYAKHPGKFGLVRPFNPKSETVGEEVEEWAATPGVVGARIMLRPYEFTEYDPGLSSILDAGAKAGIPINIMCSGNLDLFSQLADKHPNTQMVIDHLGIPQPHLPPVPENPFADLDKVISLAKHDNVVIKISGAGTLSHESFPYADIWEPLSKIFNAFGLDRCLWGTDWTRAVELLTYKEGVEAFRVTDSLSDSEREILMGGSLSKIYKWAPKN
ncbi:MAG: amidohydrolase family protein [Chloroflexota bacterium]|jgi:predicted TIM-barrel fold metal-dependent hydrolase|nr:hypothetical protein [Dehalococcoidia bacterium]MEC7912814.1 amidohydrolase family protein [Chloroflexota bacterium]|tara:strand:- start:11427 stop:12275 length:849 start_codon:yes stop_codon:yes gene_type:complete